MNLHEIDIHRRGAGDYLFSRGAAWFALLMTLGLMVFDYIDRQIIVSLFPYLKAAWGLSDKQLGALVSVVSVTVALGAVPMALFADRASRVKSIVIMAVIWSLATISCMFTRNYSQLLAARSIVGLGEAGYGSVGGALIATHFPARMRGAVMGAISCNRLSWFCAGRDAGRVDREPVGLGGSLRRSGISGFGARTALPDRA